MEFQQRRRRSTDEATAATEFLALPGRDETAGQSSQPGQPRQGGGGAIAGDEGPALEGARQGAVSTNPFWSQRAQDEAQLRAMRPQALTDAERTNSTAGSTSTELRPDPSVGLEARARLVEAGGESGVCGAGNGSSEVAVGHDLHGHVQSPDLPHPTQQDLPLPPQPSERLGMRPGERLVVEQMKDLLVDLFEQNRVILEGQSALRSRLDRVENDAMQSASSGGDREVQDEAQKGSDRGEGFRSILEGNHGVWNSGGSGYLGRYVSLEERGSWEYRAGLEEGIRRATEAMRAREGLRVERAQSPPPPPPPRDEPPTTPNGTRVPLGTPPQTPTPKFGSSHSSFGAGVCETGDRTPQGQLAGSSDWFSLAGQDDRLRSPLSPSSGWGVFGVPGVTGYDPRRSGLHGVDNAGPPAFAAPAGTFGSAVDSPRGGGRSPYTPGDRTWWKLPNLPDPSTEDACIAVSDWLTQIKPIMSDLSERSWIWWARVMEVAQAAYAKWQQAGPLEKSLVICESPADLLDAKLSRLEARALGMIMESLPARIKDELVVTKSLTCANAIYRILLAFQPGGLGERHKLLQNLSDPGQASSARQCSDQLRRWHRWLGRSQDLGVSPPDPAILLSGLDKLCQGVLAAHTQLSFRCNISRTQHQLDFCPTVASVTAYARLLQAETETLALSGADVDVDSEGPKPTKKQRAAALRKTEAAAKAAAKGGGAASATSPGQLPAEIPAGPTSESPSVGGSGKGGQGQGKTGGGQGGGKGPCRFYSTKGGCKMGRTCWSAHDFGKASAEGRCFTCGSTEHRQDACSRPQGKRGGKGEDAPRGESSGSGQGAGSGGKSAQGGGGKAEAKGAHVRQANVEGGTGEASGNAGSGDAAKASGKSAEASSQELLAEAAKLLKGFRVAAVKVDADLCSGDDSGENDRDSEQPYLTKVVQNPPKNARGLLDGGATNALRAARNPQELSCCTVTDVSLALGKVRLHLSPVGTLLSAEPVAPIVPMGVLAAELSCKVHWEGETCEVVHPTRGRLPIVMVNRCPELCAKLTEDLIFEIEDKRAKVLQRALKLKELALSGNNAPQEESIGDQRDAWVVPMLEWLRKLSPDCPEGLLARVPPSWSEAPKGEDLPLNRRVRRSVDRAEHVVLHLFAGKTKTRDFGHLPSSVYVLSIDLEQGADLLSEPLFRYLCDLCMSGRVIAVIGGPPCATTSRLRERSEWDGGPRVLRDRDGPGRFGRTSEGARLSKDEQRVVDGHTVLYFRMFLLHHIAHESSPEGVLFVLEHPMDPCEYLCDGKPHASLWAWPEIEFLEKEKGMLRASFSQSSLGHCVRKPTCLLTNDWSLYSVLHMRHEGQVSRVEQSEDLRLRMHQSRQWAKWAAGLALAIGRAIDAWVCTPALERQRVMLDQQAHIRALSKDEKAFVEHCERDHLGYRRDCNICLSSSVRGHSHVRQKYPYRNAFTLNVDLIGPLAQGEDQLGAAKHLLVGVLGVPLFKDGRPRPLSKEREAAEGYEIPTEWFAEDEVEPRTLATDDLFAGEAGEGIASVEGVEGAEDVGGLDPHWKDRAEAWNEKWRATIEQLKDPVEIVPLVFVEPIASKRAIVTLRAIQRIYTRIRLLNLGVRRLHSDSGREFANAALERWALARDIALTASVPSDPKSNGRIESVVGRCKAGIRGLLIQSGLPTMCWPHLARQWGEQCLQRGLDRLGAEARKRPLVPAGTLVTVKKREWSRKTPWSSKAVQGFAVAPSVRVPNATVVRIVDEDDQVRLYVAPVVYSHVREPVRFAGVVPADAVVEDYPPPTRRVVGKTPGVAMDARGVEPRGESSEGSARVEVPGRSSEGSARVESARVEVHGRSEGSARVEVPGRSEGSARVEVPGRSQGSARVEVPGRFEGSARDEVPGRSEEVPERSEGPACVEVPGRSGKSARAESDGDVEAGQGSGGFLGNCGGPIERSLRTQGGKPPASEMIGVCTKEEAESLLKLEWWNVEQAERYGMYLLARDCVPQRYEIEDILRRAMHDFQAKGRAIDIVARSSGARGWTLGFYVYGNKVGLTNRTSWMPNVVRVINSYLKSLDPHGSWSALRVTWGMSASPHKDRNMKGSKNFLVPISRFEGGRLWVSDSSAELGSGLGPRSGIAAWGNHQGRYVGGDEHAVWFDPSVLHAVESSSQDRIVVVGYTPRSLHLAKNRDINMLKDLGFPLGGIVKEEVRVKAAASQFGRDPQRFDISSDSEDDSFAGEWQGCGEPNHEEFVDRLTQLTREEKKAMCEEIEGGLSCVTPGLLSELHEDLRVAMLFQDHDCCERAVELERGSFALHRLKSVERELEEAWQELENTGLPCVRAVRTSGADLVEASAGERGNDLLAGEQPQELHPDFGQDTQEMKAKGAHSPPGVLLQTRIVPQAEVWQDLERWRQPLTDEVVALKDVHRAVYAIGPEELKRLEELAEVSLIPAKGVYTQKPITNRLRARIVGCGNFLQSDSPSEDVAKGTVRSQDLYAGGVDGTSVRIQACVAAINKWHNAGLDIKTAFLDAPLYQDGQGHAVLTPGDVGSGALDFERLVGKRKHVQGQRVKIVVVTPPKILVKLNLVEESERWLVIKALYGLQQAPRCWSSHRDLALRSLQWSDGGRDFRLSQTVAEPNLWRVISSSSEADQEGERLHGLLGVYVDDLLLTMEESVQQRLISEIQRLWATSDPESAEVGKPIRFCGFNLHKLPSGGYLLNQQDYIRDLLNRFPDVQGTAEVPCLRDETPEPEAPNPKQLKEAQMLAGALQWVTTRTRPDIAFSVNKTAQLMARFPEYATRYAQNIIKYLRRTADLVLKYEPLTGASDYGMSGELAAPRSPGLIEVYSDASFAPNNSKSQTGIVASLSGCIIGWASHRQSVTSQSSAEAEMYSTSDGILYIQTLEALVREICPGPVRKLLYSDSMGSVSLYSAPSGTWRTRHLRLKARGGRELLEEGFFELRHLAGRWMLADIATKALHPPRHNELVQLLVMDVPSGSAGGEVKLERCHVVSGNSRDGSLGSSGIRVDLLAMVSLRLLVIGVALANAASKWEMNTDEEANHDESVRLAALAGMLVIVAVLLLQRWCQFAERSEEPNQQVRAMRTDDSDDWPAVEEAAEDERPRDVRRSVSGSVPRSVDGLEPGVRDRSSAGLPQASEFTGVREAQAPEFTGVREAQALGYTGVGESEAPRISRIDLEQQAVEDVRVH